MSLLPTILLSCSVHLLRRTEQPQTLQFPDYFQSIQTTIASNPSEPTHQHPATAQCIRQSEIQRSFTVTLGPPLVLRHRILHHHLRTAPPYKPISPLRYPHSYPTAQASALRLPLSLVSEFRPHLDCMSCCAHWNILLRLHHTTKISITGVQQDDGGRYGFYYLT